MEKFLGSCQRVMGVGIEQSADANPEAALTEMTPTVLTQFGYSVLSLLMLLFTILSVLNNSLVIVVMVKHRHFYAPMNVFIFSLAISDLLMALCGSAIATVTNYHGYFFLGCGLCVFQGFTVNYFGLVSLCTLALLAYERYLVVCKPMVALTLTVRRSCRQLLLVWLYCLLWATAPLLGWSSYQPEGVGTACSVAWERRDWGNYSFLIFYISFCFLLPTMTILFCYWHILRTIWKLNLRVGDQGRWRGQTENTWAAFMVAAMTGTYFLCWLPYAVMSMLVVLLPDFRISPLVATLPSYFAKSSPVYNPIIYFLANKRFRICALQTLSCGQYNPRVKIALDVDDVKSEIGSKHMMLQRSMIPVPVPSIIQPITGESND